ncbi:hypothetical protein LY90DRAFT_678916 [Neocallimastix californiae]|uniref:Uncharacterized protein n=3 Tax=Neocallimastix californiae TaxID=1754190 RepID=A0A1Y1YF36_9FUNG|nr:hypothetical protein LY90DRAFT_678916 [Neocallimastix californiae]|eukprot:ORX96306.1 hypothetical protein LY90DRAFT_678916 [Neocallimastix californiae]
MKILKLFLLLIIAIGAYCSSQNHTTSNILNQLIAAIDELCTVDPNKCGPKSTTTGFPITVAIGLDELNNYIQGSIYDIIPELRRLSNTEADNFFRNELFPIIKDVIEELGINMFENKITKAEASNIVENIHINLRNKDIIAELLNSNTDISISPSLFSDNYVKKLYIYPKNGNGGDYIKEIMDYVKGNSRIIFPENKGNTNYSNREHLDETSYINEPIDYISKEDLSGIFKECKSDDICKSYFENHNSSKTFHVSIFKSIINGIERYHLLINDSYNKITTAHPITVKKKLNKDGKYEYEVDTNFAPKEVYFYKPLPIFNTNINSHVTSLNNLFTDTSNHGNNDIINDYLNECNRIRGNSVIRNLSSGEKEQINTANILLKQYMFDKLETYANDNNYDLTIEQKLRLANNIASNLIDLYIKKSNSNPNQNVSFSNNEINNSIEIVLNSEQTEYNRQNNIFDFNLIKNLLSKNPSLNSEDITKLSTMLKDNVKSSKLTTSEIDNFINDLQRHINSNPGTQFTFNASNTNVENVLNEILKRKDLDTIFKDLYGMSFCSNDETRRNMESIHKFFGRKNYHINDPSNKGYFEDKSLAFNIKTGVVFRDPKFKGKIYIPQADDINLGTLITEYKMEGYQYKDPDTNVADLNRINKNGVGKYILGQDDVNNKGVDVLDHLISVMSDDQKNTNLPQQLANLYNYLTINNNNDGRKKLHDFADPNRWANEILQYNIVDIFINSYNNRKTFTEILNSLKNGGNVKYKKITDNYRAQYDYIKFRYDNEHDVNIRENLKYVLDNCLGKGFTLKEFTNKNNVLDKSYYNEFKNYVVNAISNNVTNDLNRIMQSVNRAISQSYNVLRKSNDLLNYFDNSIIQLRKYNEQYLSITEDISKYKNKNIEDIDNDALKMHFLKEKYLHPYIGFFNNIVNENTKPVFFNFRKITGNYLNRPLENTNNSKDLYINTLMFTVGNGIYEHIFAVNIPGTINGIGINAAHLYQLDNEFVLLNKVVSKTNDYKMCQRSGIVQKTKRENSSGGSCVSIVSISSDKNIESNLINSLKLFKEKNIDKKNILPYYDNYNDISNPKYLHNNAEKITDVWKILSQLFEKYNNKFSEEESASFIMNFNGSINDFKAMLSKSEYSNGVYLINFDENDIKNMELNFNKNYETHLKNFDIITDDDGNDLIANYDMYDESESRNSRYKLIHNLNKLISIVNQNNNNLIYGMGVTYKDNKIYSEIDHRTIGNGNNLIESINSLCQEIESLDTDSLDDYYKNELNNVYNDLHELILTGNTEYSNGKSIPNLEVILKTHNTLASKIGQEEFNIDDFSGSINKISVPELEHIDNSNALDVIKNEKISSESKEFVIKGVESTIKNSENKYLDKDIYNFIINTNKHIEQQGRTIKEMQTHKGNQLFILNFVSLTSNINDLVATAACTDRIYSSDLNNNIPISTIEFDSILDGRINYVINANFNSALSSIASNNPEIYNSKARFSKEASFYWNDSVTYVLSEASLINMFNDKSNIKSKLDVSSHLITDRTYFKFAKMAGRENQVTFNTNIAQFNSNMLYVSSYISNGEKILGKSVLALSIKPNINNINAIHNTGIANNNINKPNKQYKLVYKKNIIKSKTKI